MEQDRKPENKVVNILPHPSEKVGQNINHLIFIAITCVLNFQVC